jgi:hypothetical protein
MNAYLRRRREHAERDAAVKARKRHPTSGERARRRIRIAKMIAGGRPFPLLGGAFTATVAIREVVYAEGPFKVGKKSRLGWSILDHVGKPATYEESRTRARDLVKRANTGELQIEVTP